MVYRDPGEQGVGLQDPWGSRGGQRGSRRGQGDVSGVPGEQGKRQGTARGPRESTGRSKVSTATIVMNIRNVVQSGDLKDSMGPRGMLRGAKGVKGGPWGSYGVKADVWGIHDCMSSAHQGRISQTTIILVTE